MEWFYFLFGSEKFEERNACRHPDAGTLARHPACHVDMPPMALAAAPCLILINYG
jgi:hypothetical protein